MSVPCGWSWTTPVSTTPFLAACPAIGPKLNIGRESLRRWVLRAQVDADERPVVSSVDQARIRELERETVSCGRQNEILKKAPIFLRGNSPSPRK